MKVSKKTYLVACFFLFLIKLDSSPLVVLYLQRPPKESFDLNETDSSSKNDLTGIEKLTSKKTSSFTKKLLKGSLINSSEISLEGFLATYAGYMTYSKQNGFIGFPLRHLPATRIYLLISSSVTLEKIRANTFAFEEISPDKNLSALYLFEKNKDKKDFWYWKVSKVDLPNTNHVSPITLTIHTKPENIFVQTGEFPTSEEAHLIFPYNVYVLNNDHNIKLLLRSLSDATFYEQITYKKDVPATTIIESAIVND